MPWVKLKVNKQITRKGITKMCLAGESVEVGRQTATQWILANEAEDAFGSVELSISETFKGELCLLVVAAEDSINVGDIGELREGTVVKWGAPELTSEYTCIWHPTYPLSSKLLSYGFMRVLEDESGTESWELAAMLLSLDKQAKDVGTEEELSKTQRAVGDLRIPVYESRVVWFRNTEVTRDLVKLWSEELAEGADVYHSFLRALYSTRAMICTLPANWRF